MLKEAISVRPPYSRLDNNGLYTLRPLEEGEVVLEATGITFEYFVDIGEIGVLTPALHSNDLVNVRSEPRTALFSMIQKVRHSSDANCYVYISDEASLVLSTTRPIAKFEELTRNYGCRVWAAYLFGDASHPIDMHERERRMGNVRAYIPDFETFVMNTGTVPESTLMRIRNNLAELPVERPDLRGKAFQDLSAATISMTNSSVLHTQRIDRSHASVSENYWHDQGEQWLEEQLTLSIS